MASVAEDPVVILDSVDEIRVLHRMLMDRKFDGPEDEYFGSPFIATVQHKLVDALAVAEPAKDWASWGLGDWWAQADSGMQQQYLRDPLAPLQVGDGLLAELM